MNAINSALGAGANLQEFKKYQIQSRIKIDALPNTPENQIIKYISDLYRDAATLATIGLTGEVSSYELAALKKKYSDNTELVKSMALGDAKLADSMKKAIDDIRPNDSPGIVYNPDLNRIDGKEMSQYLFLIAGMKLSELK